MPKTIGTRRATTKKKKTPKGPMRSQSSDKQRQSVIDREFKALTSPPNPRKKGRDVTGREERAIRKLGRIARKLRD